MAQIVDEPIRRYRNQAYQRVKQVLHVIREMRNGGTARDVRDRVESETGERFSIDTIRSVLWLLHDIDLVSSQSANDGIFWQAVREK